MAHTHGDGELPSRESLQPAADRLHPRSPPHRRHREKAIRLSVSNFAHKKTKHKAVPLARNEVSKCNPANTTPNKAKGNLGLTGVSSTQQ